MYEVGVYTSGGTYCECVSYGSNRKLSRHDDVFVLRVGKDALEHFAILGESLLEEIRRRAVLADDEILEDILKRYVDLERCFRMALNDLARDQALPMAERPPPVKEEDQIQKALEAYKSDQNRNLSALARDYGVSYWRLQRRAKGISSKIGNQNCPRLLTEAQEGAILRTIDNLRRFNIKFNGRDIEDFANLLLWRQYERDHPEATLPKTLPVLPRLARAKDRPPRLKLVNH
ncbi:uncharacterized protein N7482_010057 [Penicillium canariense]|uniref:Uncharacterized protein n=1 Tax=Penicillium canariense TaxID=189055 RepID=A0A9W9HL95_9EURO|nr:uncharacterized protein N7482_010057 [Penicillium canariense]KAJ5150805.1 hypothetical protein N7482_010057 [Penicillium canariense]